MITFKQFLYETMSQSLPFKWEYSDETQAKAVFDINGLHYGVIFSQDEDNEARWDVVFDIENRPTSDEKYSPSNTGNASLVFSTVLQTVVEFVKHYPDVYIIVFTAKEPSRQKFYDRWAPMVARAIGNWSVNTIMRGTRKYILRKPN